MTQNEKKKSTETCWGPGAKIPSWFYDIKTPRKRTKYFCNWRNVKTCWTFPIRMVVESGWMNWAELRHGLLKLGWRKQKRVKRECFWPPSSDPSEALLAKVGIECFKSKKTPCHKIKSGPKFIPPKKCFLRFRSVAIIRAFITVGLKVQIGASENANTSAKRNAKRKCKTCRLQGESTPQRGRGQKKTSTQMVFQRFKKQFLQHLRRRFWMPSNTSDPIRKMHTNKKRKAAIKKTAKMAQNAHKSALALYAHFRAAGTFVTPPPCGASVDFPLTPRVQRCPDTFHRRFWGCKKNIRECFSPVPSAPDKTAHTQKKPSRNSPMP